MLDFSFYSKMVLKIIENISIATKINTASQIILIDIRFYRIVIYVICSGESIS